MRSLLDGVETRLRAIIGDKKQRVFSRIYSRNRWADDESKSGPGSTIRYTENLRRHLPSLIEQFGIRSILDAPCGDLNWMKLVLAEVDVDYIGADIVPSLISKLRTQYSDERKRFLRLDITRESLPSADMMICRDCLFHLPEQAVLTFFANYLKSGIPFLLTTTHINDHQFANADVKVGGFRLIDLCAAPYRLPADALAVIDDWLPPFPPRHMRLWSRDQIASAFRL